MVENAAFEQGQKNQRGGTQTVHASNLKSWEPGEEGPCYFSRAHQFEVGSLLSSLGLPFILLSSRSLSHHTPHFTIAIPEAPQKKKKKKRSTWMCGLPFLTATVRKTTLKLREGRKASLAGLSALLPPSPPLPFVRQM